MLSFIVERPGFLKEHLRTICAVLVFPFVAAVRPGLLKDIGGQSNCPLFLCMQSSENIFLH